MGNEKLDVNWAINKSKLDRAIVAARNDGNESEENIKKHYIGLGGLVTGEIVPVRSVPKAGIKVDDSDEENEEKPLSPMAKAVLKRKSKVTEIPPLPDDNVVN